MTRLLTTLFLTAVLAGCAGRYPNFYTLSAEGTVPSSAGIGLGVGPIILAEYANRQNLVIETGPNKIEVAEYDLWAGDLENSIARILSVNMGRRLGTGNVRTYPWQGDSEIDYQIAVDIRDFIAGNDGYARIEASWRVYALPSRRLAASGTFTDREAVKKEDFEAVVAAQSVLLGRLSTAISNKIKKP